VLFLLRVALPDVPGSLGRVASAIGEAGGDIEALEIVDKRSDGTAVDDVLLSMVPGTMPDSVVSACNGLDGVLVLWIGRYAAGGNLFLDLEVVETMTQQPDRAIERLVELLPVTFRVDWAARLDGSAVVQATEGAPSAFDVDRPALAVLLPDDGDVLRCATPAAGETIVMGRTGGPEFLDSELARLSHLVGLAQSITGAPR
jgi:hypothetical protein